MVSNIEISMTESLSENDRVIKQFYENVIKIPEEEKFKKRELKDNFIKILKKCIDLYNKNNTSLKFKNDCVRHAGSYKKNFFDNRSDFDLLLVFDYEFKSSYHNKKIDKTIIKHNPEIYQEKLIKQLKKYKQIIIKKSQTNASIPVMYTENGYTIYLDLILVIPYVNTCGIYLKPKGKKWTRTCNALEENKVTKWKNKYYNFNKLLLILKYFNSKYFKDCKANIKSYTLECIMAKFIKEHKDALTCNGKYVNIYNQLIELYTFFADLLINNKKVFHIINKDYDVLSWNKESIDRREEYGNKIVQEFVPNIITLFK